MTTYDHEPTVQPNLLLVLKVLKVAVPGLGSGWGGSFLPFSQKAWTVTMQVEIVIPLLRLFTAGLKIAGRDSYHWEALPYSTVIL